jgi:hypothetical protein
MRFRIIIAVIAVAILGLAYFALKGDDAPPAPHFVEIYLSTDVYLGSAVRYFNLERVECRNPTRTDLYEVAFLETAAYSTIFIVEGKIYTELHNYGEFTFQDSTQSISFGEGNCLQLLNGTLVNSIVGDQNTLEGYLMIAEPVD